MVGWRSGPALLLLIAPPSVPQALDPGLLEAVLADPNLLKAVNPRVLQAVLVSAARAVATLPPSNHLARQQLAPRGPRPRVRQNGAASAQFRFGPRPVPGIPFPEVPVFPARLPPGRPGVAPRNVFPAFGEGFNRENPTFQLPPGILDSFGRPLPPALRALGAGWPLGALPGDIPGLYSGPPTLGGAVAPVTPTANPAKPEATSVSKEPEEVVEDFGRGSEPRQAQLPPPTPAVPGRTPKVLQMEPFSQEAVELARTLQDNPDIAQELARQIQQDPSLAETLGLSAFMTQRTREPRDPVTHENQLLSPSPPFPAAPPGVCSLVTHTGQPCDPGLAFSLETGQCEWPDTLIEDGCNPEVVTGFGPCPQDASDPRLTPAQIASWPQPMFPVNLDVVTVQNFDNFLARKFFVVCVPTVYGKLFPRLICCPDHTFFDPFHIDGCVHNVEPRNPFVTHAGTPLPPLS